MVIEGGPGDDTLTGTSDDDVINGRAGADTMSGLGSNDWYFVDNAGDRTLEMVGGGDDRVLSSVSYTLTAGSEVETLTTTDDNAAGAINLYGNEFRNLVVGNAGPNIIDGRGGADVMKGLGGDDWYFVDNASDWVVELPGNGSDRIFTTISYALAAGSEVETLTSASYEGTSALDLTGNEFANLLAGNAGNNVLDGRGGGDTMIGFGGDDWYFFDDPFDRAIEAPGGGNDRIYTSVSYGLAPGSEIETLASDFYAGTSNLTLVGNEFANLIVGNAGHNVLNGRGGVDTMVGFAGSDQYFVDTAEDQIIEVAGEGIDRVFADTTYTLAIGVEVEVFSTADQSGTAEYNLFGNEFGNYIVGNAARNIIDGGNGNDILVGLGGADIFRFTSRPGPSNIDQIADFTPGQDLIALSRTVFDVPIAGGAIMPESFYYGAAAHDSNDRFLYDAATRTLRYDPDGTGAAAAAELATFSPGVVLTHADFTIWEDWVSMG